MTRLHTYKTNFHFSCVGQGKYFELEKAVLCGVDM